MVMVLVGGMVVFSIFVVAAGSDYNAPRKSLWDYFDSLTIGDSPRESHSQDAEQKEEAAPFKVEKTIAAPASSTEKKAEPAPKGEAEVEAKPVAKVEPEKKEPQAPAQEKTKPKVQAEENTEVF